jgi:hypothetical protein
MRPRREVWIWLGGLCLGLFVFFGAIAISYFEKEPRYSLFWNPWMLLSMLWFVAAFAAFYAAANGRAFPRLAVDRFPDITVDILSTGSLDTEHEASNGLDVPAHLRSLQCRITNAEAARPAGLSATLYVKLVAGSWGRAGEGVCPPPSWALPPALGLSPMTMPINLGPGEQATGHLVFEVPRFYLERLTSPITARLELLDHVSGKQVSMPAEIGHYANSAMTATRGGAEILSPDDVAQPVVPADQQLTAGLDQAS